MRTRLIDDPDYFARQHAWFVNQFENARGVYSFVNYARAKIKFNRLRGIDGFLLSGEDLKTMRADLTPEGSKLLANALAAHKKRHKKKATDAQFTKKLQADIDVLTLNKLNSYCRAQNKDQATVLTELINRLADK